MDSKRVVPPELMAKFRKNHAELRPLLDAEIPAVRAEWREYINSLASVVGRHRDDIDAYIADHGPLTTPEVVEQALSEFFGKV